MSPGDQGDAREPGVDSEADDVVPGVLRDYISQLSNWGRWGQDDEVGTLNFVGPDQIRHAATLVRKGRAIPLSLRYDQHGPQSGGFRSNPLLVTTATGTDHIAGTQDPLPANFGPAKGFGYADDILVTPNQAGTQWDSLSHIFFEGQMWNGRSAAEVTSNGALHNGVENLTGRIVMRGVLLDFPRAMGVETLAPGYAISAEDIDRALAFAQVAPRRGDALIVRTGFLAQRRGRWGDYAGGPAPGLSLHTAPWLHEHEVGAVASDTWGVEVRPNEIDFFQPLHIVALVHMGVPFGEMFDLEPLAEDCAGDGVYEFMLVAAPLPITGAAGAPVAALAIK